MTVLSVETVLEKKSIALAREGVLVSEISFRGDLRRLFWEVLDFFLDDAGFEIRESDLFAVCRGPGSWTGLRFGLAVVKGWSAAGGQPVFALETTEMEALEFPESAGVTTGAGRLALAAVPEKTVDASVIVPAYGHLPRFRKLGEKAPAREG